MPKIRSKVSRIKKFKKLRKALGYTQEEMAQALGIERPNSNTQISRWERGIHIIPDVALRCAELLIERKKNWRECVCQLSPDEVKALPCNFKADSD